MESNAESVPARNMFSDFGRMTATFGRRDELIAALVDGFRAGGDDCGPLAYSINTAVEDADTIWLTQLWIDKDAHDATTHSEPIATASRKIPSPLAQQPDGFYGHVAEARSHAIGT